MCSDANDRKDYRIAEYNALMGKLDRSTRDLHISEVTFATAIGIFYAWLIKDGASVTALGQWVLVIPVILSLLGITRILARFNYIEEIETYVKTIEQVMFVGSAPEGWERHYGACSRKTTRISYKNFRIFIWFAMVLLTAWIAMAVPLASGNTDQLQDASTAAATLTDSVASAAGTTE